MLFEIRPGPVPGSMGRRWLDVPDADKEEAKRVGAKWDPDEQRWYAGPGGSAHLERWSPRPDLPMELPGEDIRYGQGLFVDLIPASARWTHARSCIGGRDWLRVQRLVRSRAQNTCEPCHRQTAAAIRTEIHERWEYDLAARVQRLRQLVCLCPDCHTTTHFGYARVRGVDRQAFNHLCEVTGMSAVEGARHLREAFDLWEQRSRIQRDLDLSILTDARIEIVRPGC